MANPQDAGQPIDRVGATSDDDERENIPPAFRYGKVQSISLIPFQKWKAPDNGNGTYVPTAQIIFYMETGGAAFLNPKCTYLTFGFTPTVTVGLTVAGTTNRAMLDHNTDALIEQLDLQVNGTSVEHLYKCNLYQNVKYLLETFSDNKIGYMQSTAGLNTANLITAVPTFLINNVKPDGSWFGESQLVSRRGYLLTTAITYQMAWHVKSNHIGINAQSTFPLAFINQCMLTLTLENATRAIRDCSYMSATGIAKYTDTWTYALTNVRLHYTLIMVQDEVAASIQKAYLSNALPNYMHSVRSYTWVESTAFPALTSNINYQFQLSGSSYDTLYFLLQSTSAWSRQNACSLSNFGGGYQNFQVKVNGQGIPNTKIDTQLTACSAYELYQMTAYACGKPLNRNANFNCETSIISGVITSALSKAHTFAPITLVGGVAPNAAFVNDFNDGPQSELWNTALVDEIVQDPAGTTNTLGTLKQQGCTIIAVSLVDYWAMQGQNVKGGTAIRGAQVSVEATLSAAVLNPFYMTLIATQDALLVMKGVTAGLLS